MGTWSGDIFGNDLAADVRDAYRDRLAKGESADAAVKGVRRAFAGPMRDADDRRTVWIALAATQLETGAVGDEVRVQAVKSIAWCESPGRDPERFPFGAAALAALRERLGGKPPVPAKRPKPKLPPGEAGDVVAVVLPDAGVEAVVHVAGLASEVAGPAGRDRGPDCGRIVLLFDLAPAAATAESVAAALSAWRRLRRVWHDGLGHRVVGCYEASGKLPARRTRVLLRGVAMPAAFAARVRGYGDTHRSADLPWVVENDLAERRTHQWVAEPGDPADGA